MKALTIRNVQPKLARALEREAKRRDLSLNQTVLDLLTQALGIEPGTVRSNGLKKLAGTWTDAELAKFESDTAAFAQIDAELWS
jgi:hypothetical protein